MLVCVDMEHVHGAGTEAFKILADPTRFKILSLLFRRPGVCVNEIADEVGISHSAASHQLAKLEAHGVVMCQRDGKEMCYEVCRTTFTRKLARVMNVFSP